VRRLVDEYFKRDLTESEEQQLAEWLDSHPEDSALFARRMKDLYEKSGLPEPIWPHSPVPVSDSMSVFKWLAPLVLFLLAFGFYEWRSKMGPLSPPLIAPSLRTVPLESQETPVKKYPISKKNSYLHPEPAVVVALTPLSAATPGSMPPRPAAVLFNSTPLPASTPIAAVPAASSGRQYEQLSVVVDLPQGGLATVRVIDGLDNEVGILYAGILPAGRKTFTWDGKTEQGVVATPGRYFVEIKSGKDVMRQEIRLGPAQAP
jgi:hypothetical protein